ncbi:MAG TPA: DUF393 domain-containing protein [Oligoflexia bacterium]|nr:DUF393 domain-containing protein [Oligoflexia bacterium]HMP47977.1 DUF393 domain-containing protein [Oligoflexia bacterium]
MNIKSAANPSELTVFYDGSCPLCSREMSFIKKRDHKSRIRLIDISDESFDPTLYSKSREEFMKFIHALTPDGKIIMGVEVFREIYQAIGLGYIVSITRLPVVSQLADFAYLLFAKNRLRIGKFFGVCNNEKCSL